MSPLVPLINGLVIIPSDQVGYRSFFIGMSPLRSASKISAVEGSERIPK